MNDKASVSTVKEQPHDEPVQWWGYSKEHGWVVLDRTIPCNAPGLKVDLLFLRCRDVTIYSEKREHWIPPRYRFAPNHILELASPDAGAAAAELAKLKSRWPEFEREIQLVHRVARERLEAARIKEEEVRKQSASEKRKRTAAGGA
jgi:hypothetical protein